MKNKNNVHEREEKEEEKGEKKNQTNVKKYTRADQQRRGAS